MHSLRAVSFFLVRRAKRTWHENDHARDWRRRPRFSTRLAVLSLNARARVHSSVNLKKKRDCSQSYRCTPQFNMITSCIWEEKETDGTQIARESIRFSSLFAAEDVSRETSLGVRARRNECFRRLVHKALTSLIYWHLLHCLSSI